MRRSRCLFAIALVAASAQACGYAERRWNDFCDVGSVSVGMGVEISGKLGEALHLGLGSSLSTETAPIFLPLPGLYQLMYGGTCITTEHWLPLSLWVDQRYGLPAVAHSIRWQSVYPYGPTPTDETRRANPDLARWAGAPPQHRCFMFAPFGINRDPVMTDPRHMVDLEISLFLLFGAKIRFRPFEALDFLAGIFGLDVMGDDIHTDRVPLGPYWYKTPRAEELREPSPPEVPVGTRPPNDPPYVPRPAQPQTAPSTYP